MRELEIICNKWLPFPDIEQWWCGVKFFKDRNIVERRCQKQYRIMKEFMWKVHLILLAEMRN